MNNNGDIRTSLFLPCFNRNASSSFVVRLFGNIQHDVGCWFMREILYLVKEVSLYSWLTKNYCQEWALCLTKCFLDVY